MKSLASGFSTGYISTENREALKVQYLQEIEAKPGCTICPDFYRDLQIHFRIQLKQNGFTVKKEQRKYMIADGGHVRIFGEQKLIVNDGDNTADTEVLTDAKAEALLEANPELSELIVFTPEYLSAQAEAEQAATDEATGEPDEETEVSDDEQAATDEATGEPKKRGRKAGPAKK